MILRTVRPFIVSTIGLAVAAIAGCGSSDRQDQWVKAEPVGETNEALVASLPQCNANAANSNVRTQGITVQAVLSKTRNSYYAPFPNAWVTDPTVQSFERQFYYDIPRANGYEYLVRIVENMNGQWVPVSSQFFLIGITDALSPQPYYSAPPSSVRWPWSVGPVAFSPTTYDYSQEESIDGSTVYRPSPVLSDSYACVTVVDEAGRPIDYFVLAGTHDPSGQPW